MAVIHQQLLVENFTIDSTFQIKEFWTKTAFLNIAILPKVIDEASLLISTKHFDRIVPLIIFYSNLRA